MDLHKKTTLLRFNNVPVNVEPPFWVMWGLVTAGLYWLAGKRRPERTVGQRLLMTVASTPFPILADIGHALAHTVSARYAGAPMDEVLLTADMPRTLYDNNDVPPQTHRLRALGGPIYSAISLLLSLCWRTFSPPQSAMRELAEISCVGHSVIFAGSLLPVPIVDGGTILKWTLVQRGAAPDAADAAVRRTSLSLGLAFLATGAALLTQGRRLAGSVLSFTGAAAAAAGVGLLK